jgi:hypothetical protein
LARTGIEAMQRNGRTRSAAGQHLKQPVYQSRYTRIARRNIVGLQGLEESAVKQGSAEPRLGPQAGQYCGCLGAIAFQHTPQARCDLIE